MDRVVIFADHNIGYDLVDFLCKNQSNYSIIKVFTNYNSNAWWKKIEKNKIIGISLEFYDSISTPHKLLTEEIDYLLMFSWKHIIPDFLINHIKKKAVNLHYSLLPNHKGVYPVNNAIRDGDKITGVSFHVVENDVDSGGLIAQKKINILWTDDAFTLLNRLDKLALQLFKEIWVNRDNWENIIEKQISTGKYNSRKDFELSNRIDLDKNYTARELINLLRSKTFQNKSNAYFIDENTGEEYSIILKVYNKDK